MYNPVRATMWWVARGLSWLGLLDARRAERTVDLAWPRIVTGLARISQRAVDLAMVGTVLGPAAIAGIGFASPYWGVGNTIALGIAGGTISQVSQRYGAGEHDELEVVVTGSVLVELALATPFVVVFLALPEALIGVLSDDPAAIGFGATYLSVLALSVPFEFVNKVGSRTLVGADDAWTPMVIRGGGAVVNIVLNVVLIFGLGLGVAGAALGTVIATVLVTAAFAVGSIRGSLPYLGAFPVTVDLSWPLLDVELGKQLLQISLPLVLTRVARTAAQFPLLAIAGGFGSGVVAAYVVSRRIRALMNAPGWGFGLASSSLVGQELGRGEEAEAEAYGWDVLRFSLAVYTLLAALVFLLARPIGRAFVSDPAILASVVVFVRVAAVSVLGNGVHRSTTGPLRASGDTRWPLYGRLLGLYGFAIPIAYAGLVTPLGVPALYIAMIAETAVPAAVTLHRFNTGRWKAVSRSFRPDSG